MSFLIPLGLLAFIIAMPYIERWAVRRVQRNREAKLRDIGEARRYKKSNDELEGDY